MCRKTNLSLNILQFTPDIFLFYFSRFSLSVREHLSFRHGASSSEEDYISSNQTQTLLYHSEESNCNQHGHLVEGVSEVLLVDLCLAGPAVIDEGVREAVEEAEALLVGMVAVVSSALAVHAQVPLPYTHTHTRIRKIITI